MTNTRQLAATHITHAVLAAAWRENHADIRRHATHQHPTTTIPLPQGGTLTFTAHHHPYNQITPYGPITTGTHHTIDNPATLLRLLAPDSPDHATDELNDATDGLTQALQRHQHYRHHIRQLAHQHHTPTTTALAKHLQTTNPQFLPCRFFEPLAVHGHHLHPCARTRLGWTHTDRTAHDLESHNTTHIRFVAARRQDITATPDPHGHHLDTLLAHEYPALAKELSTNHIIIPVHPWQYHHVLTTTHRELFDNGTLTDLPGLRLQAEPTSSIRTLITSSGHYLKCSLDIQITSTRRGISPATAHNGPILSPLISHIIDNDPHLRGRLAILPEHAAASLPHGHPAARDLTCLLRAPLAHITTPHEQAIPATALPATSPVTGHSILTELIEQHQGTATDFITRYAALLLTTTIHLASHYGIGLEAHLQNCIPTFTNGTPHRIIQRDLGGARIHLPRLHASGHTPPLHPASVTTTHDITTTHTKVGYTALQNHLAALINTAGAEHHINPEKTWTLIRDIIDTLDIPTRDRNFYTAATMPHKALLSMRLKQNGDHHIPVTNPMHTP